MVVVLTAWPRGEGRKEWRLANVKL